MGRDGIEPSTSGLKVQAAHQHARPTTCTHNDLVVHGRAAWWRFEAVSVPNLCQINSPKLPNCVRQAATVSAALLVPGGYGASKAQDTSCAKHGAQRAEGSSGCLVRTGEDSGVDAPTPVADVARETPTCVCWQALPLRRCSVPRYAERRRDADPDSCRPSRWACRRVPS
jgi:hypothetical protein